MTPESIDRIIQDVAELGDRTSPEEWPEAMLVTAAELRRIIECNADAAPKCSCCGTGDVAPGFPPHVTTCPACLGLTPEAVAEAVAYWAAWQNAPVVEMVSLPRAALALPPSATPSFEPGTSWPLGRPVMVDAGSEADEAEVVP